MRVIPVAWSIRKPHWLHTGSLEAPPTDSPRWLCACPGAVLSRLGGSAVSYSTTRQTGPLALVPRVGNGQTTQHERSEFLCPRTQRHGSMPSPPTTEALRGRRCKRWVCPGPLPKAGRNTSKPPTPMDLPSHRQVSRQEALETLSGDWPCQPLLIQHHCPGRSEAQPRDGAAGPSGT
jgi:hypothetical protein